MLVGSVGLVVSAVALDSSAPEVSVLVVVVEEEAEMLEVSPGDEDWQAASTRPIAAASIIAPGGRTRT